MACIRSDGRQLDQLRELSISYECLCRTDGSACFGFGETKALASVSGPMEARLVTEQASRATFEVIIRPLASVSGTESKSLSFTLRSLLAPSLLLSQNPRTLIQLVVQSLAPTSDRPFQPSLVASLINASTLALLNAGAVPMRGVVCAVAIGRLHPAFVPKGTASTPVLLILDPDESESTSLEGGGCFAFIFAPGVTRSANINHQSDSPPFVVWSSWQPTTSFDENELVAARDLARAGAERVRAAMKESVWRMGGALGTSDLKPSGQKTFTDANDDDDDKMDI